MALKCRTCRYYRGSCRLGLEPNEKCMFYKPSKTRLPAEKLR